MFINRAFSCVIRSVVELFGSDGKSGTASEQSNQSIKIKQVYPAEAEKVHFETL